MAKCKLCGREMLQTGGCKYTKIKYQGKIYNRIRFCEEGDSYSGDVDIERCPDCGARPGECHHYGCDVENSPVTHAQMLDYECVDEFLE